MPTKAAVSLTELDFDDIRASLKTHFEADGTFTDYNFEGSGLAILLDILAYNTHYSAFMANMLANESFLDSAQVRNNVVSLAKMIGYTPISRVAPQAVLSLVLTTSSSPATIDVPKGTKFTTTVDGTNYAFIMRNAVTFTAASAYTNSVILHEGELFTFTHTVNTADSAQKFIIPNSKIDTSTLIVNVQTSASNTTTATHTLQTDYTTPTGTSTNFFLQAVDDFLYEIYFGDGVIGKSPVDGELIISEYIATNAGEANGATIFTLSGAITGVSSLVITTTTNASGGAERQTIDGIKRLAPKSYSAQGRVVTANDYRTRILQDYPSADAVKVYGGEDADPQEFGKVFIAVKPATGLSLTTAVKNSIKTTILQPRNILSVRPEIIDPDYLYVVPTVNVKYNPTITTDGASVIESQVRTTIQNYSNDSLESFDSVFHYSALTRAIDETNNGITSNLISFKVKKLVTPTLNATGSYTFDFRNSLYNPESGHNAIAGGIVTSTSFTVDDSSLTTRTVFFDDDGAGNLRMFYFSGATRVYLNSAVGTVNYTTGKIIVSSIVPTGISNSDNTIALSVIFNSLDIIPLRDQIVEIRDADIIVTVTEDTAAATGSTRNYGTPASSGY